MTANTESGPETAPTITFIIGAARSGTTWLARALGADDRIAATYETHLFNAYLGPLMTTWDQHLTTIEEQSARWNATGSPPDSAIGLPYIVTTDQWHNSLKRLVLDMLAAVADAQPSVQAIVEKTPSHSGFVDRIDLLTNGKARYVHIIRNGLDVVDSTRVAGSGWAADWAPRDPATAARKWAAGVRGARSAARFEDRYYELRYEDLVASPAAELQKIMQFIGVDAERTDATKALERTDDGLFLGGEARTLFAGPFPEPRGFRRSDRRDSVAEHSAAEHSAAKHKAAKHSAAKHKADRDRAIVISAVGDLLEDLGYGTPEDREADGLRKRVWLASGAVETTVARIARLVNRIRDDVEQRL